MPKETLTAVAGYNRDDCAAALALRGWLEELRAGLIEGGEEIARPPMESGDASEAVSARQAAVRDLINRLLIDIPIDKEDRNANQQAIWTLAHILDWHRREVKVVWSDTFGSVIWTRKNSSTSEPLSLGWLLPPVSEERSRRQSTDTHFHPRRPAYGVVKAFE